MAFNLEDYRAEHVAAVRPQVARHLRPTPLLHSQALSTRAGVDVYLKCENLQPTGSFKIRGALAALSQLAPARRDRGMITSSTGNHGTAMAWAGGALGVACTVVVPAGTPEVKRGNIAALGATLVESPRAGYDATQAWTLEQARETGRTFVSPFEDPWVVAGNGGTTGLEILEALPDVAEILVPVGGGGLAAGLVLALETAGSRARLVGVNARACPGLIRSLETGIAQTVVRGQSTLADAIEGGVGEIPFQIMRRRLEQACAVSEASLEQAVAALAREEHLVAEGAGAAGVAALLEGHRPMGPCVVVVSGGNINAAVLADILRRG